MIATLPGTAGGGDVLLLAAHYDTVPASPGASDDAVGVATLLEVARALAHEPRPARDVAFLLSDGEEIGLLGVRMFARNVRKLDRDVSGRLAIVEAQEPADALAVDDRSRPSLHWLAAR